MLILCHLQYGIRLSKGANTIRASRLGSPYVYPFLLVHRVKLYTLHGQQQRAQKNNNVVTSKRTTTTITIMEEIAFTWGLHYKLLSLLTTCCLINIAFVCPSPGHSQSERERVQVNRHTHAFGLHLAATAWPPSRPACAWPGRRHRSDSRLLVDIQ